MPLLEVQNIHASYGGDVDVLHGIALSVDQGEFVTLIGANGAGKSSTLKAVMGMVRVRQGAIRFDGQKLPGMATPDIARLGISMVPEGRGVFPGLSVHDNLRVAATPWLRRGMGIERELEMVYELFPVLKSRDKQFGWSLSGGQQQMLAIGRALIARPRLLLLDEPSLGLAPILVEQVFKTLQQINRQGVAILLVEQNAFMALEVSQRAYVMEQGRITVSGSSSDLLSNERVRTAYLGA